MAEDERLPDIPEECLTEIGRVTVKWAMLESVLDLCLMRLAGKEITDPRSLIIFNHMAFPMKLDIMGALVTELLPGHPGLAGFPAVHQGLKQAQEKRNLIAHSKWGVNARTGEVEIARLTARGKLKMSVTSITAAEIRAAADVIAQATQDLYALVVMSGTTNNPLQSGR